MNVQVIKTQTRSADGELRGTTERADSRLIPSIVVMMKHLDRWRFGSGSSYVLMKQMCGVVSWSRRENSFHVTTN